MTAQGLAKAFDNAVDSFRFIDHTYHSDQLKLEIHSTQLRLIRWGDAISLYQCLGYDDTAAHNLGLLSGSTTRKTRYNAMSCLNDIVEFVSSMTSAALGIIVDEDAITEGAPRIRMVGLENRAQWTTADQLFAFDPMNPNVGNRSHTEWLEKKEDHSESATRRINNEIQELTRLIPMPPENGMGEISMEEAAEDVKLESNAADNIEGLAKELEETTLSG